MLPQRRIDGGRRRASGRPARRLGGGCCRDGTARGPSFFLVSRDCGRGFNSRRLHYQARRSRSVERLLASLIAECWFVATPGGDRPVLVPTVVAAGGARGGSPGYARSATPIATSQSDQAT
ncbi:MAG TPA: hypothetical protein VF533_24365 [Solirubrobacteraceae bacterium]